MTAELIALQEDVDSLTDELLGRYEEITQGSGVQHDDITLVALHVTEAR